MIYIVEYINDWNKKHIITLSSFKEVKYLKKHYKNVTIISSKQLSPNIIKNGTYILIRNK